MVLKRIERSVCNLEPKRHSRQNSIEKKRRVVGVEIYNTLQDLDHCGYLVKNLDYKPIFAEISGKVKTHVGIILKSIKACVGMSQRQPQSSEKNFWDFFDKKKGEIKVDVKQILGVKMQLEKLLEVFFFYLIQM